jgi:hypothetical protein
MQAYTSPACKQFNTSLAKDIETPELGLFGKYLDNLQNVLLISNMLIYSIVNFRKLLHSEPVIIIIYHIIILK